VSGRPRRVGAAAIASAALILAALLGPPWPPAADASAALWQAHVADQANRLWLLAAAAETSVAAILFLAFLTGLPEHGLLARNDWPARFASACGILFVVSMTAAWAAWVSVPAGVQISGEPVPSGDIVRFLNDLGQAFIAFPAPLCAGAFAVALAVDGRRAGVLPRWLIVSGLVVGIVQIAGVLYFPLLLFLMWTALVGLVLLRRPSRNLVTAQPQEVAV
jgi:hypothetical protein